MPEPWSPRDVLDRLLEGIADGDWQALHDLYSDDAVIEYPFALPKPRRSRFKQPELPRRARQLAAPRAGPASTAATRLT
jgi:hypothetical protein